MTRKALARRIAEPYLTSQQRREAPAPPQPEGLRGFWPGALLLVSQRPQRVFSFLAPRTQPKFAAAGQSTILDSVDPLIHSQRCRDHISMLF
jgi:hypothetical protein